MHNLSYGNEFYLHIYCLANPIISIRKLATAKQSYFFALRFIRMRAVFERKVWSECENGEWNWGYTRGLRTLTALRAFASSDLNGQITTVLQCIRKVVHQDSFSNRGKCPGGRGTPYNGLYGEAPPERGTFLGSRYMKGLAFHELKYRKG